MRVTLGLATFLLPLIFAACADLPSGPNATPGDMLADCRWNPDGSASCDPVESAPDEPPACDPYLTLGGCDDNCEMSAPGMDDPEHVGIAGCNNSGMNPGPEEPGDGTGTQPPPGEQPTCPEYDPACDDTEEPADDELADCVDLGCDLRDPTDAERKKILDLIGSLRTDGFCAEVRESAMRMVNRHVQVWDKRVKYPETGGPLYGAAPWDYARGGQVMYIWTGALTAWTIAHEAIHGIWNPSGIGRWYTHSDITPAGLSLDATAGYCSGH
jgi:hypothetical protein